MAKIITSTTSPQKDFFFDLMVKCQKLKDWFEEDYQEGRNYIIQYNSELDKVMTTPEYDNKRLYSIINPSLKIICMYLYTNKLDDQLEDAIANIFDNAAIVYRKTWGETPPDTFLEDSPLELIEALAKLDSFYMPAYRISKMHYINKFTTDNRNGSANEQAINSQKKLIADFFDSTEMKRLQSNMMAARNNVQKEHDELYEEQQITENKDLQKEESTEVLDEIKKESFIRSKMKFFMFIGSILGKIKQRISVNLDTISVKMKIFGKKKVSVSLKTAYKKQSEFTSMLDENIQVAEENQSNSSQVEVMNNQTIEEQPQGTKSALPDLNNQGSSDIDQFDQKDAIGKILNKHGNTTPVDGINDDVDEDWN